MGKRKKLWRLNRMLAMVLAVAITVTALPATALAAPDSTEDGTEQSVEQDSGQQPEDDGSTEETAASPETDKPEAADGESDQDPAEEAETTDPSGNPDGSSDTDQPEADDTVDDETGLADGKEQDSVQADQNAENSAEGTEEDGNHTVDVMADGVQREDAKYNFEAELSSDVCHREYSQGQALFASESETDGKKTMTLDGEILAGITLHKGNMGEVSLADTSDPAVQTVTYAWQKEDGTALGEGISPKDAGKYKLAVNLPAKAGQWQAADITIDFEIIKAVVRVELNPVEAVPGTLGKDMPMPTYFVDASDGMSFTAGKKGETGKDIELTTIVKKADTDEVVGAEEAIVKGQDYIVTMQAEFAGANAAKYAANYEFACASAAVTVGELQKTAVKLTLDGTYATTYGKKEFVDGDDSNKKITKVTVPYEGAGKVPAGVKELDSKLTKEAVALITQTTESGDKVTEQKLTVKDEEWKGVWFEAEFSSENDGAQDIGYLYVFESDQIDEPKTAGTYVYRVTYTGDQEKYGSAYADMVVEIGAVELVIRPKLEATEFFSGQKVQDVLEKVQAEVLNAKDESAFTIPADLKDRFWGTSYADSGATQSYEPTFRVVRVIKDAAGALISEEELGDEDNLSYELPDASTDKVTYEVRFSGYKAVYDTGGRADEVEINADYTDSTDTSYRVKDDGETLRKYVAAITLAAGELAVIDTSKIGASITEKTEVLYNALTKTYDGDKIFVNRADYKKAELKDGKTSNKDNYVYTWYESAYDTVEDATETDADGKLVTKADFNDSSRWLARTFISPSDAGIYKLHIEYTDPAGKVKAEPADVYFVIRQQEVKINLVKKEGGYQEFSGIYVEQFLEDADVAFTVTPAGEKPSKAEDWKNAEGFGEDEDWSRYEYLYIPDWKVEVLQKNADGTPQTDADGKQIWVEEASYETLDKDSTYRIALGDFYLDGSKGRNFKAVAGETATDEIKITAMGEAELAIVKADNGEWTPLGRTVEYNGKSIINDAGIKADLTSLADPAAGAFKLVSVKADGTKTPVSDAELTYEVRYQDYVFGMEEWSRTYQGRLPLEAEAWADAVNAGTYEIHVSFRGNGTYGPMADTILENISVAQKELKIHAPELTVEAGTDVYTAIYGPDEEDDWWQLQGVRKAFFAPDRADVEGYVPEDEAYFTKQAGQKVYPAWIEGESFFCPEFGIYDEKGNLLEDSDLLTSVGNKSYHLRLTGDGSLWGEDGICANNYTGVPGEAASITVTRGSSVVQGTSYNEIARTAVSDRITTVEQDSYKHTVVALNAVPFTKCFAYVDYEYKEIKGNWVAVKIFAPMAYGAGQDIWNTAVYEAAVRSAGGMIVTREGYAELDGKYRAAMTVLFDAAKQKDANFNIRWKDGDIEQFCLKFSDAVCMGNLEEAVAPKSLSFNAPIKTMAVGETQKLDVKITKEQNADVICLGYEVDQDAHGKFLHVDEYGKVTALGEGKATVTVYPMREVNGKKEKLDTKVKATVTITVKKVTAPKITKVTMTDAWMNVQYSLVNDGYRREVYVMEGKNLKEADFTAAIGKMKNGKWQGIFAQRPNFISPESEKDSSLNGVWDSKKKAYVAAQCSFSGLKPEKEYTVYVRNVSAVRTLEDGCKVQNSFAGSAKGFVMTKPQVEGMEISLKEGTYTKLHTDTYFYDEANYDEVYGDLYEISLAADKPEINLTGIFPDTAGEAERYDSKEYALPLKDADAKKTYVEPKISYYFYERFSSDGRDAFGDYVAAGDWGCTTTCSRASIAKNGKITVKQPGMVRIMAMDTNTGVTSNYYNKETDTGMEFLYINITAEADEMKARSVTLSVGQRIKLESMVDYRQKGKVLDQSCYRVSDRISREAVAEQLKNNASFKLSDDGYVTAYGKDSVKLKLKDKFLDQEVEVNLKSTELAPVKGLTLKDLYDNSGVVQFEKNPYATAYRIEVRDGSSRKTLIRSVYVKDYATLDRYWDGNYDGSWSGDGWWYENNGEADKKYKEFWNYSLDGLTQKSKYEVTVTALFDQVPSGNTAYEGVESKPASKAFMTTLLPASESDLGEYGLSSSYNGIQLRIRDNRRYINQETFVSGNTYTLVPDGHNKGAQYAMTDTLIWSSSDPKVATIKANTGSYSATFKAVKDGRTKIEVRSKLTKKVIARYWIDVKTVGDAYNYQRFYGENENLRD